MFRLTTLSKAMQKANWSPAPLYKGHQGMIDGLTFLPRRRDMSAALTSDASNWSTSPPGV